MIDSFFNPQIMWQVLPSIIDGIWITVALSILVILSGTALGLGLATVRALQNKPTNLLIIFFVDETRSRAC